MNNISEESKVNTTEKISSFRRMLRFFTAFFVWGFAAFLVIILSFFAWIYTGHRSIPYVANYTAKTISELLPASSNLEIEDVLVTIDDNDIVLKVINPSIKDGSRGDFELSEVDLRIDVVGFFPQSNRNILSIEVSDPKLQLNKLLNAQGGSGLEDQKLPIELINSYLNEHKAQLVKFSLSLNNTKFSLNISEDKALEVTVNNLTLAPNIQNDKIVLSLYGDINLAGNSNILDLTIDTSKIKYLELNGGITNISTLLFESLGYPIKELAGSNIELDINFKGKTASLRNLEHLEFELSNFRGKIVKNDYFVDDVMPTSLYAKGTISENAQKISVDEFDFKVDGSVLTGNAEFDKGKLKSNLKITEVSVANLSKYWPTSLISRTRDWVFDSVLEGGVKDVDIALNFDFNNSGKVSKNEYLINFKVEKASLKLDSDMPLITDVDTDLSIDGENVKFTGTNAVVNNVTMTNFKGNVDRLGFADSTLTLKGDINGKTQNIADLAFEFSGEKNELLTDVKGDTKATLSMKMKIFDDIKSVNDLNLVVAADISEFASLKIVPKYPMSNGKFKAKYTQGKIDFEGAAKVDALDNVNVQGFVNILNNAKEVKVSRILSTSDLKNLGLDASTYLTGNLKAIVHVKQDSSSSDMDLNIKAIFDESSLNIPQLNTYGLEGKEGYISVFAKTKADGDLNIHSFDIKTSQIDGAGSISVNGNNIVSLASRKIKFGKSEFAFKYTQKPTINVEINGDSFDYSVLNLTSNVSTGSKGLAPQATDGNKSEFLSNIPDAKVNIAVNKLYLKANEVIYGSKIEFESKNKSINKLILNGTIENAPIKIEYLAPRLVLNSQNAGIVFRGLGIYENMDGGKMFASGLLEGDVFSGDLVITDFRIKKAPILAKILSVASISLTSFSSLESIIGGKGVKFDKLIAKYEYSNGNIKVEDFIVKGPSLALSGQGDVNLAKNNIKLKGTVVPENIINKAVKNIPVINKFLGADKKDEEALGVNYTVNGDLTNPKVDVNPLSILAPGFLKKILGQ